MFIHMQMAKEKQNLLLVTFEKKMNKARFECYLLNSILEQISTTMPEIETMYILLSVAWMLPLNLLGRLDYIHER